MYYYFAYGSNMDELQMKERCPDYQLIGKAILNDYKLAFTIYSPIRKCGCADIVSKQGSMVYGLLYALTEKDMNRMDIFEGHPNHYHRVQLSVQLVDTGEQILANAYEVVKKEDDLIPSKEYLQLLQGAASKYQFPETYQEALIRLFQAIF